MLQQVGESLGAIGCLERHARGHRARDEEELPLDGGSHAPEASLDDRIEPTDRMLQAPHHGELWIAPIPVLRERDDLSHGPMMGAASDMLGRSGPS
jgi:hypothetical protein